MISLILALRQQLVYRAPQHFPFSPRLESTSDSIYTLSNSLWGRGGSIGRASDSTFHDPNSNPVRCTRKTKLELYRVIHFVLTCRRCALTGLRVYILCTHRMTTYLQHVKHHVVHVRVRWIAETRKEDPGCILQKDKCTYVQ